MNKRHVIYMQRKIEPRFLQNFDKNRKPEDLHCDLEQTSLRVLYKPHEPAH